MELLRDIDYEGIQQRKKKRLKRRVYRTKVSNCCLQLQVPYKLMYVDKWIMAGSKLWVALRWI